MFGTLKAANSKERFPRHQSSVSGPHRPHEPECERASSPLLSPPEEERGNRRRSACGFTLIELLAVVVMVVFLVSVLATALATTRTNTSTLQCLNNLCQLGATWAMYADDNEGRLVPYRRGTGGGLTLSNECWVAGLLDFTSRADNTNIGYLIDHVRYPYGAYFGPYLRSAEVFKCPSDRSVVVIGGQQLPRSRSVSMSNYGDPFTSRPFTSRFTELGQFTSPADVFIILDERPDSLNDGVFMMDPDTKWQLVDFPGFLHDGAGNFVFADGHTATHRWEDPRTVPELVPGQPILYYNINVPNDVDVLWLARHATGNLSYPN